MQQKSGKRQKIPNNWKVFNKKFTLFKICCKLPIHKNIFIDCGYLTLVLPTSMPLKTVHGYKKYQTIQQLLIKTAHCSESAKNCSVNKTFLQITVISHLCL